MRTIYEALFNTLAGTVVEGSVVPCTYDLPDPPQDKTYNFAGVILRYSTGGNGVLQEFESKNTAADCGGDHGYYVEGQSIHLCPASCTMVQADDQAQIDLLVSCDGGYVVL